MKKILLLLLLYIFSINFVMADGIYMKTQANINIIYLLNTFSSFGYEYPYNNPDFKMTKIDILYMNNFDSDVIPQFNGKKIIALKYRLELCWRESKEEYTGEYGLPHYRTVKKWHPNLEYKGFITEDGIFIKKKKTINIPNLEYYPLKLTSSLDDNMDSFILKEMTEKFTYAERNNVLFKFPEAFNTLPIPYNQ